MDRWKARHSPPWDAETTAAYRTKFPLRIEQWLDAGEGECVLRQPDASKAVESSLRCFDGARYDLLAYVVMPNHVHVIVRLRSNWRLEKIVQAWKSWTAREINRLKQRTGALWQEGYWDRLVRDDLHLARCLTYIERNPMKARLREGEFRLWVRRADEA